MLSQQSPGLFWVPRSLLLLLLLSILQISVDRAPLLQAQHTISQKHDGSKDKEKTWVDLAQSLLLSSFVYNMCKGEKAEEKEGF